jgi:hypothetical protein
MTVAEVLIATAIALSILGGVIAAVAPAQVAFATQQERVDLQQRVRVAVETIAHDIRMAASIRPYRTGAVDDDGRAGVFFRAGTLSVRLAAAPPGGPVGDSSRTYYLRVSAEASQLMRYDGAASSFPVLDDVVGLSFEYFGEPDPPEMEGVPPRATYGPTPPPAEVDDPSDAWGRGENCTFAIVGGVHTSRLAGLGTETLPLAAPVLTDGPWCPDQAAPDRFDADLLRVRRVRVHVRLQAPPAFRGPASAWFVNGGTAADVRRRVPDQQIQVDVALRNWHAGS